jgi:hypothetical protein
LLKALDKKLRFPFLNQKLADNPYNRSNIPGNFRILERRVKNFVDDSDKSDFLEYITENCELIVVIIGDLSEAFQFFDSQNSRGKSLHPHDLLKAYHLREMNDLDDKVTEQVVKEWEDSDQNDLSSLFSDYLYRVKEWMKGNYADELGKNNNIQKFKGISEGDNYPYAQFYKRAFVKDKAENSAVPFQLDTPILAGKQFFDYAKHFITVLKDIQNTDEGTHIKDNEIIKTLNLKKNKEGTGNKFTRLLLDTAILLYVSRFYLVNQENRDSESLNHFVKFGPCSELGGYP